MESKACDKKHETIIFQGRHCPLCDALTDRDARYIKLGRHLDVMNNMLEELEEFKAKCVCGKLAGE